MAFAELENVINKTNKKNNFEILKNIFIDYIKNFLSEIKYYLIWVMILKLN